MLKLAKLPDGTPEVFYTIQGEGLHTGKPSVFMRLSLCNLHCTWCDTPYTWNWENTPWESSTGKKFKKEELILNVTTEHLLPLLCAYPCQNLVITGGEPLLQQEQLAVLIRNLPIGWSVEVETNGTIIPSALEDFTCISYNVSPKLSHSGNSGKLALRPDSLRWFSECRQAVFKFVLSTPADLAEVKLIQSQFMIPSGRILLMPRGTTSQEIKSSTKEIVELCLSEGYRFSDRLHVHIWGDERAK